MKIFETLKPWLPYLFALFVGGIFSLHFFGGRSEGRVKLEVEKAVSEERVKQKEQEIREKDILIAKERQEKQEALEKVRYWESRDSALLVMLRVNNINKSLNDKRLKDIDARYGNLTKEQLRREFADY